MPATFVTAGTGTFTIDGSDYSCQVVSFDPGWNDTSTPSLSGELTACGDRVPADESNTDYPATPTLGIVHDWTPSTGISMALAAAVGTEVAMSVTLDADQAGTQGRNYVGSVIVPPMPDSWVPGKIERADSVTFTATVFTGPTAA
jgi:hypothetical protein